ncbi:hypothetical protein H6F98_00960 [Microcoleus sp. FACHB-SPT15]|uniref:hypothetical protein n=1 Tax=Microcoleus sp. FACHB-SPT15 TaxID=2692830 RepID=UPI001784B564|nr:hypothetical protein [Microcoleus sp. FACHB-SPT15]MBD1804044.1 hypothetical protein [Microcoleus sp. FACHB-SPT15]
MSEVPGQYNKSDGTPFNLPISSAEHTTLDFVTAINSFHWKTDYFKFCQVLGLTSDSYAEEKYSQFQELISNLNQFDVDLLTKMIESGENK